MCVCVYVYDMQYLLLYYCIGPKGLLMNKPYNKGRAGGGSFRYDGPNLIHI